MSIGGSLVQDFPARIGKIFPILIWNSRSENLAGSLDRIISAESFEQNTRLWVNIDRGRILICKRSD